MQRSGYRAVHLLNVSFIVETWISIEMLRPGVAFKLEAEGLGGREGYQTAEHFDVRISVCIWHLKMETSRTFTSRQQPEASRLLCAPSSSSPYSVL